MVVLSPDLMGSVEDDWDFNVDFLIIVQSFEVFITEIH